MSPLDLFLYVVAGALGLAAAAFILGAVFVVGGAMLRRFSSE